MIEEGNSIDLVHVLLSIQKSANEEGEKQRKGITTRELSELMEIPMRRVDDLIRRGMAQGLIECHWVARPNRSGHSAKRPAYFLTEEASILIAKDGGSNER